MFRRFVAFCAALVMIAGAGASVSVAQTSDQGPAGPPRIGFVVGNAAYQTAPLATALNDAGLVAEALRSVGFEIVEGADLGASDLVRSFREYLAKLEAAGPDAVGFVYLSGYGFAFEGENYLAGIDARLERESDVPLEAVRVSDLVRSLAGAPARARVLVLDAARKLPFRIAEQGLPPGLVAVEAPPGMLIGFSAGPGQIAPDIADPNAGQGAYGAYATAIAEMVRAGGLDLPEVFTRIRARTHQITEGRQTPWDVSALTQPVVLVPAEAAPDAPAPALAAPVRERRPFRDIPADEAYAAAVERDDLAGYVEFVETYPQSPYAKRVWVIIRARREALAWMKAVEIDSPQSYWTYLRRYPKGIYAADARRRLARLSAAYEPPPDFAPVEFADVPPPLPDEPVGFYYDDYPPAPPPPVFLIAPRPRWWVDLPPPPPPVFYGGLPPVRVMPVIPRVRPGVRIPVVLPGRPLPPGPGPVIRPGGPRPVGPGPVGPGPGFRPGGPGVVGPGPVGPGPGVRPGG
ncbi:caspase family protein, partial [Rhodoplanes sp. TEM]